MLTGERGAPQTRRRSRHRGGHAREEHRHLRRRHRQHHHQGPRDERLQALRGGGSERPQADTGAAAADAAGGALSRRRRDRVAQVAAHRDRRDRLGLEPQREAALGRARARLRARRQDLPLRVQPGRIHRQNARGAHSRVRGSRPFQVPHERRVRRRRRGGLPGVPQGLQQPADRHLPQDEEARRKPACRSCARGSPSRSRSSSRERGASSSSSSACGTRSMRSACRCGRRNS